MGTPADPTRRGYHQSWRERNRQKCQALTVRWKQENRERYNQGEKENAARRRKERRLAAIKVLGGCCAKCGFKDERALQFDHRTPILRRTKGVRRTGTLTAKEYKAIFDKAPHDIQVLCANCHAIKNKTEDCYAQSQSWRAA